MAAPVVVIGGPTASGKSALAVDLAERFDGVVINADSVQLYRELAILTARPGPEALGRAPHRLFGIASARDRHSAGSWRGLAAAEILAAQAGDKLPIVVGGTGLYLKALTEGIAPVPEIAPAVGRRLRAAMAADGPAAMHSRLMQADPIGAARIRPSDPQRILRALEVLEATGEPLHVWQARHEFAPSETWTVLRLVVMPDRAATYAACDARFEAMIERGAVEEARALGALELDETLPAMKALGLAPLLSYCRGELGLPEAVDRGKRDTRRYARRQMTWFRHQMAPDHLIVEKYSERSMPKIFSFVSNFQLTLPR